MTKSKHSAAANEYVEKILDGPTSERWDRFDIETAFQAGAKSRDGEIRKLKAKIADLEYIAWEYEELSK